MKSGFQAFIIGFCIFMALIAVLMFTGVIPGMRSSKSQQVTGQFVMWGSLPEDSMRAFLNEFNKQMKTFSVKYVYKDPRDLENDLVSAIASNKAPDLLIFTPDLIINQKDKMYVYPTSNLTESVFNETFTDGGKIFWTPKGALALPLLIDPMMMYVNNDIVSDSGIAIAPQYWRDFNQYVSTIVRKNDEGAITRSMLALGEYDNVTNAKQILAMLMLQLDESVVTQTWVNDPKEGVKVKYLVTMNEDVKKQGLLPAQTVLTFIKEYSDPVKATYSWNKTLPNSRDAFVFGQLAFYFGFASENQSIYKKAPLLSYSIKKVPQTGSADTNSIKRTYGRMYGIGVLKSSTQTSGAFYALNQMVGSTYNKLLSDATGLPSARRDLLSVKQEDAYKGVVWPSALIARDFVDPNSSATNEIFRTMVTSFISGRSSTSEAAATAASAIKDLINR